MTWQDLYRGSGRPRRLADVVSVVNRRFSPAAWAMARGVQPVLRLPADFRRCSSAWKLADHVASEAVRLAGTYRYLEDWALRPIKAYAAQADAAAPGAARIARALVLNEARRAANGAVFAARDHRDPRQFMSEWYNLRRVAAAIDREV